MANSVKLIPKEIREMVYPELRFLSEAEQIRYDSECQRFGDKARASLNVPLKGSNLWKILLLNDMGIVTPTLPEMECGLENGLDLRGTYEDTCSVILRSAGDTNSNNDALAKGLAKKLKIRRFTEPLIIEGLGLVESAESSYGLDFKLTNRTNVVKAPDFSHANSGRKFVSINPDYTLNFADSGNRTLYTRSNGLSGVFLGRNLDLGSNDDYLAGSDECGRVLVRTASSGSNAFEILQKYRTQVEARVAGYLADAEMKGKEALKAVTKFLGSK